MAGVELIEQRKAQLRGAVRASRARRDPAARAAVADGVLAQLESMAEFASLRAGAVISAYVSFGSEPGTAALLEQARGRTITVLLPRLEADNVLGWVVYDGADGLAPQGPMGIPCPTGVPVGYGATPLVTAELVVLPALAADARGARCGRGAGWYDRALADLPLHADGGPLRVVVVHDDEVVDEVPTLDHDAPVDVVVTDRRVIRVAH
jgi:5-formyltetrahydrofolate cyclo-ligase